MLAGLTAFVGCATGDLVPFPDEDGGTMMNQPDTAPCTTMCSGMCADTKTDANHCGKCGNACPAGAMCVQGSCQCAMMQSICNKACVDLKTDVGNCGKCGTACGGGDAGMIMGGGMWACVMGACQIQCPSPKVECAGACVDTKVDNDNCGACGTACMMGTEQCVQGMCCKTGETVCSMTCANTNTDSNNCGMCGTVCPNNTPVCLNGTCQAGCADMTKEVQFQGKCYYLDGSTGMCDQGYALASNANMAAILANNANAFAGKNYKHKVSGNCCIWTSDNVENYGMTAHCNTNGPFSNGEPIAGGTGCTNVMNKFQDQLTFCAK